jgi:hypothetical protein
VPKIWLYATLLIILSPPAFAQRLLHAGPSDLSVSGSPLLFDDWVKAKVVSRSPFFENDSSLLFNFNLATQKLLATVDKKTQYKISGKEFQSVTFYKDDVVFTFEHVPVINDRDLFCEVVKNEGKYSLYSLVNSEIRGYAYTESTVYYIIFPPPDGHVVTFRSMDKRLIRKAFALNPDQQKVEAYLSDHDTEAMNGYFLKKLVEYLDE